MNSVLMLVHNCLELTKRSVESVLNQNIPITLYIVDNDSDKETADTLQRLLTPSLHVMRRSTNGVSSAWNFGLDYLFNTAQCEYVLVLNNDVELRPDTYRSLIADGGDFVSCVSVGDRSQLDWDGITRKRPHPDFSAFLIRRNVWDTVGPFDESMVFYASDADYHVRMHKAGIEAYTIGIPFYHVASGTLKTAPESERMRINWQADQDRDRFAVKWGVRVGSDAYYHLFNHGRPEEQ